MKWRFNLVLMVVFALAAIMIGRLFYIQVVNHKFYQAQALGQQVQFTEVTGERGKVFFSLGKENDAENLSQVKSLAVNEEKWIIFANVNEIKDKSKFVEALSDVINQPPESIFDKIIDDDSYSIIKKDLSFDDIENVKSLNLDGLYWQNVASRFYPQKTLASQVIGFLGGDGNGQYGIEGYYEDVLQGKQSIRQEKRGFNLSNLQDLEQLDGADLYLTLDYNIQFQSEYLLKQAFEDFGIESGQIIVLEPNSGKVLALANFPAFDPNEYSKEKNLSIFQNSATQKLFEPGSVFKPFTMAMALEEGKITPATTFVDTGSVKIGPDTIYNFDRKSYGKQDMSGILEKSINTGAVFLEQLISRQVFINYIDKFGFNTKTGIELQGEVSSRNDILKKAQDSGFATASFGQGIEMTPLQLVRAFSVFANGGRVVNPYIVDIIALENGKEYKKPQISEPVISEKTISEVTIMLTNVVERGFGKSARVPGYWLAGKTGTAQVPIEGSKGYYPDKTIQSFIGFGPALNPRFVILVKLDNPKVSASAVSAAPIFKKLSQYIIDYWQIPPDYQSN